MKDLEKKIKQQSANIKSIMLCADFRRQMHGVDGIDIWNDIKPSDDPDYELEIKASKRAIFAEYFNLSHIKVKWF